MMASKTFSWHKSTIHCKKFLKEIIIFVNNALSAKIEHHPQPKHFIIHKSTFFRAKNSLIEKMRTTTKITYRKGKPKYKRRKIRRRQHSRFLNRYNFAYTERVVVNQAIKGLASLTPNLIGQISREIDKIA